MSVFSHIAYAISGFNRARKFKIFNEILRPSPCDLILDAGFSNKEYSATDNFLEKNYPYKENITALSIDDSDEFSLRYPEVRAVRYDGTLFPFKDKQFDIGWSNAVIEHTGSYKSQLLFLKELYRTSKKLFLTTPNRYFPVEIHTRILLLHFLPKKIFDKILIFAGKRWATGHYMNLLSGKQLRKLLAEAGITNYIIKENKILFFTLDFVVIIK